MKKYPDGAIVTRDESKVIGAALNLAIEFIKMNMESHSRPNKAFHDDEYRQQVSAWKESLVYYQKVLRKVRRVAL